MSSKLLERIIGVFWDTEVQIGRSKEEFGWAKPQIYIFYVWVWLPEDAYVLKKKLRITKK